MNSSKLLLSFLIFFSISAFSQTSTDTSTKKSKKAIKYYYKDKSGVNNIGKIKAKSALVLGSKLDLVIEEESIKNKSLKTQLVVAAIKLGINVVSSLVYKPKKFEQSNSAKQPMITMKESIEFKKINNEKIYYFNYIEKPNSNTIVKDSINQIFAFSIHNNPDNDKFKILKFDSYLYKYSGVKLKRKHHKINLLFDFKVSYFDENGFLKSIDLESMELEGLTPKGESSKMVIVKKDVFRYIPTKYQIESIKLTVNEVNARKKTWDKWLKLYNDNKDKIKDAIVDKIQGDDEEE